MATLHIVVSLSIFRHGQSDCITDSGCPSEGLHSEGLTMIQTAVSRVAVDGIRGISRGLNSSTSNPSLSRASSASELINHIRDAPHVARGMYAGASLATFQPNAGFDLGKAKDRIDDLTFCTLFDGKEFSASFRNGIVLPHLMATSHAAENLVFFDCTGETTDAFKHLSEMQLTHGFKLACVDESIAARAAWSQQWMEEPEIAMEKWPSEYTGTLRLALHQCFSECKTRYCAWADSDIMLFPTTSIGWAPGSRQCLVDAAKLQSSQRPPVFFSPSWYYSASDVDTPLSRPHFNNAHFEEFSSQAFVVDKPALYKWLPIPNAALHYHEDPDLQDKFQRLHLPELRDQPLLSAIERLVVAKSTHESADCLEKGFTCSAVVQCDPWPATKVHLGDFKRNSLKRYGVNLSFELTEIDKDLTSLSRLIKRVAPPSEIDRQLIEVERLRKIVNGVIENMDMKAITLQQALKGSRRSVSAKTVVSPSEQVGALEYMLMCLEERLRLAQDGDGPPRY